MNGEELPQLRMRFANWSAVSEPRVPQGYALRTYNGKDDEAWLRLLNAGDFGTWDQERLGRMKNGERAPLPLDGVFFATRDGDPIGTACVFLYKNEKGTYSEYGWLVVDPAHRGKGLGAALTKAALVYARDHGHHHTYLKTEDFRLAAIKTYLKVGFQPEMEHCSSPNRWKELRQTLGV